MKKMSSPSHHHVLLTGSNGFIGSHILAQLLEQGHSVCCPVRSASKGEKILQDFSDWQSQIEIAIVPDIVAEGAYDDVLKGTEVGGGGQSRFKRPDTVIHTASPFLYGAVQSNLEFLDPAIKGTLNLLRAVKQHGSGSVKRVVFTSSCASVIDYDCLTSDPPRVYTEEDWNPITWEEAVHGDPSKAYRASKKFAELAAWKFMKDEKPDFDLVTLCPPATFGPLRNTISSIKDLNESNSRLWKFCFQSSKDAPVPYIPVHTYVDVRDLAKAQIQAMLLPSASNNRFIVCARQFNFQEICDILRSRFPAELNTRTPLGNPGTNSLPSGAYTIDNSKVKTLLKMEFRDLEETVVEVARQMLEIERLEEKRGILHSK